MASPQNDTYTGIPGTTLYGGRASAVPPTPGDVFTTLTFVNDSATEQPAGVVSRSFGLPIKQGDMPAGEYPVFEQGGVVCPATLWGVTTWPDGSMKFCAGMLRFAAAVAGSGSASVVVKSGGSLPASSNRALSDLAAADLSVALTGVTNLSGEWVASLNDAIAAGADVVQIGDGPAGAVWRVGGDFKQGGTAHGQLYGWHYVAALQNAVGAFAGIRHLCRVAQPWADVASPTPTRRVFTAALKSGATTLRSLQGHDTTETVGSNIGLPHYASIFTAAADGHWDFVQGGGSQTAECTVRHAYVEADFIATRLVPPYDASLTPASSASVDYAPMGRGPMVRNMGTTGERIDIGVLPSWVSRHVLTQAETDTRVCRVAGLASGGWRQCARKQSTKQIVACVDVSAYYAGLGTIQTTWHGTVNAITGMVSPADATSLWASEYEPSHRPSAAYYPYVITGRPEFLDLLVEHASGIILNSITGSRAMNTTLPITASTIRATADYGERDVIIGGTTYKGGGYLFTTNLSRIPAWGSRDVAQAAAIYPDTCPAGSETRKYLREVVGAWYGALNVYNGALGSDWSGSGIYCFDNRNDAAAPWCNGYFSNAVCHSASILGTPEAQTLRAYLAQFWQKMAVDRDLASVFSFDGNLYDDTTTRVTQAEQVLTSLSKTTLTFDTGTGRFTVGGEQTWAPTNGDVFAFYSAFDADKPFSEAVDLRRLYVVNASGNTGQLALAAGGAPIAVTSSVVVSRFLARVQNMAPATSATNDSSATSYLANITSAIRHHAACGDAVGAALSESAALAAGTNFSADPKNGFSATYPGA